MTGSTQVAIDPRPMDCFALYGGGSVRCRKRSRPGAIFCGIHARQSHDTRKTIMAECRYCGKGWTEHDQGLVSWKYEHGPDGECWGYSPLPVGERFVPKPPPVPVPEMSREQLHARISDVLRRSGVEDAEQLIRGMEVDAAEIARCLTWARRNASPDAHWQWYRDRIDRALSGREIGPPKPASEQSS